MLRNSAPLRRADAQKFAKVHAAFTVRLRSSTAARTTTISAFGSEKAVSEAQKRYIPGAYKSPVVLRALGLRGRQRGFVTTGTSREVAGMLEMSPVRMKVGEGPAAKRSVPTSL